MIICHKCGCQIDDESKSKELWQILVMLKRELDPHDTNPDKFELPKSAWDEAVKRAKLVNPNC